MKTIVNVNPKLAEDIRIAHNIDGVKELKNIVREQLITFVEENFEELLNEAIKQNKFIEIKVNLI